MEKNYLETWGRGNPVLTAAQDRKTTMSIMLHLSGPQPQMVLDAGAIRDEFAVPNVLTWSPFYPEVDTYGLDTYPSSVAPLFSQELPDNLRYFVNIRRVLDWTIEIERGPYMHGTKKVPVA